MSARAFLLWGTALWSATGALFAVAGWWLHAGMCLAGVAVGLVTLAIISRR